MTRPATAVFAAGLLLLAAAYSIVDWRRAGELCDEVSLWQDAVEYYPADSWGHYNLGTRLVDRGQVYEGRLRLEEAFRLAPHWEKVADGLGATYTRLCDDAAAIPYYQRAVELRPDSSAAHNNLGAALLAVGRPDEARPHFIEAIRLSPSFDLPHNNLGTLLARTGDMGQARTHFQAAVRLKPTGADAWMNLARAHAALGQPEPAIAAAKRAIELARAQSSSDASRFEQWLSEYQAGQ